MPSICQEIEIFLAVQFQLPNRPVLVPVPSRDTILQVDRVRVLCCRMGLRQEAPAENAALTRVMISSNSACAINFVQRQLDYK